MLTHPIRSLSVLALVLALSPSFVGQLAAQDTTGAPPPAGTEPATPPAAETESAPKGGSSEFQPVKGLENWSHEFDINGYKPGRYNILIRAVDAAGNVSFGEPLNLMVDPESDRPVVSVVNPLPAMRVGGDLNIVGTCVDDDAVAKIEVKVDDGEWIAATGTDFWSHYLKTAELPEGYHTLSVRGFDPKGIESVTRVVGFHLDRSKPLHEVKNPAFGALVSGKIRIEGSVFDANALADMKYSTDGAKTWVSVKLAPADKTQTTGRFFIDLDTKKMEDGPAVVWFKSVDKIGSVGIAAFLAVVDNTKPDVKILKPETGTVLDGSFTVIGRVYDRIGVKRLSWQFGTEKGELELVPGNPYFTKRFELPAAFKSGDIKVTFEAEDTAGNVTVLAMSNKADPALDLPVVTVIAPTPAATIEGAFLVTGSVKDDDGVSKILWKVDQGAETEVACNEAFSFELPTGTGGKHVLSIRAVDRYGTPGPVALVPYTGVGAAPTVTFATVSDAAGQRPYQFGVTLAAMDGKAVLQGAIEAPNGISKIEYALNGGTPAILPAAKGASGAAAFNLPVPVSYGVVKVDLTVTDAVGKTTTAKALFHATNYTKIREEPAVVFVDARIAEGRTVPVSADKPFVGAYTASDAVRVELVPATRLLKATLEGRTIRLEALAEGRTDPTVVRIVTAKNHNFDSQPLVFETDAAPPAVAIAKPVFGAYVRDTVEIVGSAKDGVAVDLVEYSLDGSTWTKIDGLKGDTFSVQAKAPQTEGPFVVSVRARDKAGNQSLVRSAAVRDVSAPQAELLVPKKGDKVGSAFTAAVRVVEPLARVAKIEVNSDGSWKEAGLSPIVAWTVDRTRTKAVAVRVTDKAGNVFEKDYAPELGLSDVPAALPASVAERKTRQAWDGAGSGLKATGTDLIGPVSFALAFADSPDAARTAAGKAPALYLDGAATLTLSLTGVTPDAKKPEVLYGTAPDTAASSVALKAVKTTGTFDGQAKLAALPEGAGELWFVVMDAGVSKYAMVPTETDVTKPSIEVVVPAELASGAFTLVGRVSDANGIASIAYAAGTDKGQSSYNPGDPSFAKTFELGKLTGPVTATFTAVDAHGNAGQAVFKGSYDAKSDTPAVQVLIPAVDEAVAGLLEVIAYAEDDDGAIAISALGKDGPVTLEGPGPLYRHSIDLEAGKRSVPVEAVDASGVKGSASVSMTRVLGDPTVAFAELKRAKGGTDPFVPGMTAVIEAGLSLSCRATAPNRDPKVEYAIGDGAFQALAAKAAGTELAFDIPLPEALPYERIVVRVRVTDALGRAAEYSSFFYRVAPTLDGVVDDPGLYAHDTRDDGTTVKVTSAAGYRYYWNGRPLKSVALEPANPALAASFEGGFVTIAPQAELVAPGTTLAAVTVDGDRYTIGPVTLIVDDAPPAIAVEGLSTGTWVRDTIPLKGSATDSVGVSAVEYTLDGGEPVAVATKASGKGSVSFDVKVPLESLPDGVHVLLVRALDPAGVPNQAVYVVNKDTVGPALSFVTPAEGDVVNGTVTAALAVLDAGDAVKAEFSSDGKNFEPVELVTRGYDEAPVKDEKGKLARPAYEGRRTLFSSLIDLTTLEASLPTVEYRVTDAAGNSSSLKPFAVDPALIAVDKTVDKPTVQVQVPQDMEVMRGDFVVSGMAFDDDKVAEIWWRVDGGAWAKVDGTTGFSVPFKLLEVADNEHSFEAYAVDVNGVKGDVSKRVYRVSREEPTANLVAPTLDLTNRGLFEFTGTAADANGIAEVWVSFDNGSSYAKAEGAENWKFKLDSRLVSDGTVRLYVKTVDKYGTEGFYASLFNVDNTAPEVVLNKPVDGNVLSGVVVMEGRSVDSVIVESLVMEITPFQGGGPVTLKLPTGQIFRQAVDLSAWKPGWYNIRVTAMDHAKNMSYVSRDVIVEEVKNVNVAELVFPVNGDKITGAFDVDGRVRTAEGATTAVLYLDGQPAETVQLDAAGFFTSRFDWTKLEDGEHSFYVEAQLSTGKLVSGTRTVSYAKEGPWITVADYKTGDYVIERPWLRGEIGWNAVAPDKTDRKAFDAYVKLMRTRLPKLVEVSRDDGRTFVKADLERTNKFRFRLQTQDYPNGDLRLIIKATMADGTTVVRKRILNVDTRKPVVDVLVPRENGLFNERIRVEGVASDNVGLRDVQIQIRQGDKASYQLPGFIQGSFLDVHLLGATRWESGIGLSFFGDNVKLQVMTGQGFDVSPTWDNPFGFPVEDVLASRFSGFLVGAKLLANVAYLPFNYWFGPDWDFFSMSFAVGATFTYFSQQADIGAIFSPPGGKYMVLSGVVGQWECAKFTFQKLGFPKSVSIYLEGGLVFIPSEASTNLSEMIRATLGIGSRIGLF